MPEATTLDAPVGSVTSTTPPAPPPPKTELHVSGDGRIGTDAGPVAEPPKKGSARDSIFSDLRKKAVPTHTPDRPTEKKTQTPPDPQKAAVSPEDQGGSPESATTPGEAAPTAKGEKKPTAWQLVDTYKKRVTELETAIAEAKKGVLDPKEKETLTSRLAELEKQNQEWAEEIRYTNYSKHPEFTQKYQKPYEEAWKKAMDEMGELTLTDPGSGSERPIRPQDMLELVNMPLKKAREMANALFGDFADDIMSHRNEIKRLFDAQQKALEEARKGGADRDAQRKQQYEAFQGEIQKQVKGAWETAAQELAKDESNSKFFKPVEGDEDGNQRLQRGFEMAAKALSMNPNDPRLTPQQRADAVKAIYAVHQRAAAAGRLVLWYQRALDDNKKLRAELDKYRQAEPGKGEGNTQATSSGPARASDQVYGALRKLAH